MANSEYNYIPTYIRRTINNRPKDVVTSKYWNELFNLLITQGDHTAEELGNILNHFSTRLVGVESEIAESAEAIANIRGTTYIAVDSTNDVISTVNGETYADIQALIDAGKPVVARFDDDSDFYYFETFRFSDSSGIHKRLNFRCDMGSIVYTLTLRDDNTWVFSQTNLQTSSITDTGGYFTTDTVEGALQEIGADLAGGTVKSVNGKTGTVVLNAEDVGAQRTLIAGSGITIIPSDDGDHIQSDAVCGNGEVSFVDVAGGAPIASFTLNQTQDCEINVNDLIQTPLLNNYRTAAAQDAIDAGKQDKLIAGDGITIIPGDNGDTIQANTSGIVGNGLVSFVNEEGGASIAQFTLNQTQDCEINVNDLTAHLHNKFVDLETSDRQLELSLSNNYRTAAAQDVIDNRKLTDAPTDGKAYARKNGSWHEIAVVDVGVEKVNGKTGVVTLNATEIPSTKFVPKDTISFLIDGAFDEALVELKRNGASASANDFIAAVNSGSTVTISLHDQGNNKVVFDDRPVKYKITGDTLSLCFIAETGHQYTPAIYVLSGATSGTTVSTLVEHNFTDSFYQEHYVSANDLPVQAPLSVEEYLEELESSVDALQSKTITDTGDYFTTDTVEGALQELGAGLAGTYSKPSSGIPKTDFAVAVQTSLDKADTALQSHQSLAAYRTAAAQDIIDNGKQDKITSTNKLAYSLISGTPTIPTVPTNVSTFTNDAGYLTLAALPKYEGVVE